MTKKLVSLLVLIFVAIVAIMLVVIFPFWGTVSDVVAICLFLFIYLVLAPKNVFFTFVKEGTAKAVVRGDGYHKMLIQWDGYTLDEEGNVIKGKKVHLLGGLRFYGIWLIDKIHKYKFEWTGLQPNGAMPEEHKPEMLDSIFVKQYVYVSGIDDAEDIKGLPLTIKYVLTIQTINPYKALFKVHNWLSATLGRVNPEIRNVMAQDEYSNLIKNLGEVAEKFKSNINDCAGGGKETIVQALLNDYGVKIVDAKILIIDPPSTMREATLIEFNALQEKKGTVIKAEAEKAKKILDAEGKAKAIEIEKAAYGGGEEGVRNLVTVKVSENIKDGHVVIGGEILKAIEGLAGTGGNQVARAMIAGAAIGYTDPTIFRGRVKTIKD